MPTAFPGPAAAAGGHVSGDAAPQMVGLVHDATNSYANPMVVASLFKLAAARCILLAPRPSGITMRAAAQR